MKPRIEWTMVRRAVGTFVTCLLLSGVFFAASFLFRNQMQDEFDQHQTRFREVSQQYLSVDGDEKIIKQHYPRFIELYNRGVIGSEKRLNWVETLQAAGGDIKLPEMHYQIDSRKPYKPDFELNTGAYDLYATNMTLNLGLLHEIDLAKMISDLNKDASGLYNIRRCRFSRTNKGISVDPNNSNISADCELQWYSLDLSGERGIKL